MAAEKEEMKGRLLEAWIEDLRNDRQPRKLPEMNAMSPEELDEVMQLARWHKTVFYPSHSSQADIDLMAKRLSQKVYAERLAEEKEVDRLTAQAVRFADAVRAARLYLRVEPRALEPACALPDGSLNGLESGQLPPYRVPLDKMISLLKRLRFSRPVVELIRRSSLEWVRSAYSQEQTQLARIDPGVSDAARLSLLQQGAEDAGDALAKEIERIKRYCSSLACQLS